MIKLSNLVADVKSYAQLLKSVAQQGTHSEQKRPLTPVECAKAIQRLIDEENETLDKIAERLNLGKPKDMSNMYKKRDTTQITSFLNLLKVSEKSRNLAGWAYESYPKIPFSVISQLSTMTPDEQDVIIQSIFNTKDQKRIMGKEDIKKIKKWRGDNPTLPIRECIEKVLKLKPVTVITHILVFEINDKLGQFINTYPNHTEKLLGILHEKIDGKFLAVNVGKSVMAISMDEAAYRVFSDNLHVKGTSYAKFLDSFLENYIG